MFIISKSMLSAAVVVLPLVLSVPVSAKEQCTDSVRQTAFFMARFAATNLKTALVFKDRESVKDTLRETFTPIPWVRFVYVFNAERKPFAGYVADSSADLAVIEKIAGEFLHADTQAKAGELLLVKHNISYRDKKKHIINIGYLVLASDKQKTKSNQ
jgi:hypothetical protein